MTLPPVEEPEVTLPEGMTHRDMFALAACFSIDPTSVEASRLETARQCWAWADAMIATRDETP